MPKPGEYSYSEHRRHRYAKISNLQNHIKLSQEKYDDGFPDRIVTTWEYAGMREKGWDKPRSETRLPDYIELCGPPDYSDPVYA